MTQSRQRLSPVLLQSSVGLLLLVSLGVLFVMIAWLKNLSWGQQSYQVTFLFSDAARMLVGTRVDYRGVRVGQVTDIRPGPQGVAVKVSITPATQVIPRNLSIEAKQSGLIGETNINLVPYPPYLPENIGYLPLDKNCNPKVILCNGAVLRGEDAIDTNALIRSMMRIANFLSQPEFAKAAQELAKKAPVALADISQFSKEAAALLGSVNKQGAVGNLNDTLRAVNRSANDISGLSQTASQTLQDLRQGGTIQELNTTVTNLGQAAKQIQSFLAVNESRLGTTLTSIQGASDQLRASLQRLEPPLSQLLTQAEKSQVINNLDQVLKDLTIVSANATTLTKNLNEFSTRLNDPQTILLLQQLLDSARSAVQNLEKITSDVDQVTGDPAVRQQLMRLIQGLSNLLSSTEHLDKQIRYAQQLNQLSADLALVAQAKQSRTISPSPLDTPRPLAKPQLKALKP
ncbi:MlaD family protein [Synechocystis sp. LKSZ1]|uniref:MlaD family protein n=1 Tax=Synechocystis sp. LKSZ1 TaxID=3144951 RepID=UPI00336BBD55